MSESLRLSTGYEVQFRFDSPKWKADLRELAYAIIGERLVAANAGMDDRVKRDLDGERLADEWLEECRYLCATSSEEFKTMLMAAVMWDAIVRAWKRVEKGLPASE